MAAYLTYDDAGDAMHIHAFAMDFSGDPIETSVPEPGTLGLLGSAGLIRLFARLASRRSVVRATET